MITLFLRDVSITRAWNEIDKIHAEFGIALDEAKAAGVEVLFLNCHVEQDNLMIID